MLWITLTVVMIALADAGKFRSFFDWIERHPGSDKVGHFFLMGGLSLVVNLGLRCRRWKGQLIGSWIVGVACFAEEYSQRFISTRHFDWGDLVADFFGILIFGWVAVWILSRRPQL